MGHNKARQQRNSDKTKRASIVYELHCTAVFDAITDIGSATANLTDEQLQNLLKIAKGQKPIDMPRRRRG